MSPRPTLAAFCALALAGLSGCAAAPRAKPLAPRAVSAKTRAENDQRFYRAVSAYVQGDYPQADTLVSDILRADPSNKDALALRRRVNAAESASRP